MSDLPSQSILRELLDYNPETGKLFWRARNGSWFDSAAKAARWNGRYAGTEAFTVYSQGAMRGNLLNKSRLAHRVIWKWLHGHDARVIDHINGDPGDNREHNLRSVSQQDNLRNTKRRLDNTSGATGVSRRRDTGRYSARIRTKDGRYLSLGCFDTLEEAEAARLEASIEYGYHQNHGRTAP